MDVRLPKSPVRSLKRLVARTTRALLHEGFRRYTSAGPYLGLPVVGALLKRLGKLEPQAKTQTYTLNLDVDLSDRAEGVVLPIDMMKAAVRRASYRAVMKQCLCRAAYGCKDYPHNFGCLFLGGGARGVVTKRLGREVSLEEALAHVDEAARLGLIGQAMWVEVERFLIGAPFDGVSTWLEICFCCPCCCGAYKLARLTRQADIKGRFRSVGWKAQLDAAACKGCQTCVASCPVQAIAVGAGGVAINPQTCLGCGFCAAHCPEHAVTLHLQEPIRGTIEDYFARGGLRVEI